LFCFSFLINFDKTKLPAGETLHVDISQNKKKTVVIFCA